MECGHFLSMPMYEGSTWSRVSLLSSMYWSFLRGGIVEARGGMTGGGAAASPLELSLLLGLRLEYSLDD